MTPAFALLEGGSIFAVAWATAFLWLGPLLADWVALLPVLTQASAFSFGCVVAFYYNGLYDLGIVPTFERFASRLPRAFALTLILLAPFYALLPAAHLARGALVSSVLITLGVLLPFRAIVYAVLRGPAFHQRVLVVGTGPFSRQIIARIDAQPHSGYAIVGVVDDGPTPRAWTLSYPLLGPVTRLARIIDDARPQRIIVALETAPDRLPIQRLLEALANDIVIEDGVTAFEHLAGKLALESLAPSTVVFSQDFRDTRLHRALGRAISVLVSAVGLVVFAPLFGVIALAIKLDSRGRVLFVHERVGLRGKRFKLLKFRTMHPARGATSEWARDNDHRVTRIGTWLRKFRLDELPQLINVLRGDMNLVGPRPHPASNFDLFNTWIPYYALRAMVRPGMTGWAQVRYGYANDLDEEIEKMRYDLYYIKHQSLGLDLRILFDTVTTVLLGRGSATAPGDPADAPVTAEDLGRGRSPSTRIRIECGGAIDGLGTCLGVLLVSKADQGHERRATATR